MREMSTHLETKMNEDVYQKLRYHEIFWQEFLTRGRGVSHGM